MGSFPPGGKRISERQLRANLTESGPGMHCPSSPGKLDGLTETKSMGVEVGVGVTSEIEAWDVFGGVPKWVCSGEPFPLFKSTGWATR